MWLRHSNLIITSLSYNNRTQITSLEFFLVFGEFFSRLHFYHKSYHYEFFRRSRCGFHYLSTKIELDRFTNNGDLLSYRKPGHTNTHANYTQRLKLSQYTIWGRVKQGYRQMRLKSTQ